MLLYKTIEIDQFDQIQEYFINLAEPIFNSDNRSENFKDFKTSNKIFKVSEDEVLLNCTPLKNFLLKYDLIWGTGAFFFTEPDSSILIHKDGSPDVSKYLALNLPIYGYKNSEMIWWDNVEPVKVLDSVALGYSNYNTGVAIYDSEKKTIIDKITLTQPTLVRIDVPHNIQNYSGSPRLVFSLRFTPEPWHLWPEAIV